MAFKGKNKRCACQDDSTTSDCNCSSSSSSGNTVATQKWVSQVFNRIYGWVNSFKTRSLQVLGTTQTDTVLANNVNSNRVYANELVLSDKNGRPVLIYIDDDGTVKTKIDFEGVYIFPGIDCGLKFYQFAYDKEAETMYDNFKGLEAEEILAKFVDIDTTDSVTTDGVECPRLCLADGLPELVEKTILVTCNASRKIVGLSICDDYLEPIKRINLPCGKAVRKLTINMPSFVVDEEKTRIELPSTSVGQSPSCNCPCCGSGFVPSEFIKPVASGIKLDPSLFDDSEFSFDGVKPQSSCGCSSCRDESSEEPTIVNVVKEENESDDVKYECYASENYSNIVLKRSVFGNDGKRKYLVVETEKI